MEFLKDILIAIGGGTTALVAALTIFKSLFLRVFDRAVESAFDKNIEKYRNHLSRTTTAYELLLSKELTYYSTLDPHMATLVPLIQDLSFYAGGKDDMSLSYQREKFREHLLTYLKMIPEIKNGVVLYQPYIPQQVFSSVSDLIKEMQNNLDFWNGIGEILYEKSSDTINVQKANEISNTILDKICFVELMIKKRLEELAKQ